MRGAGGREKKWETSPVSSHAYAAGGGFTRSPVEQVERLHDGPVVLLAHLRPELVQGHVVGIVVRALLITTQKKGTQHPTGRSKYNEETEPGGARHGACVEQ